MAAVGNHPGDNASRWSVRPVDAWRLLTGPMSEEEAGIAARAITSALPHVYAAPTDPRTNLVLAWDRSSVELIRDALVAFSGSGNQGPSGIIANLEEWLAEADPREDLAVPLVEELLASAATRYPLEDFAVAGKHVATHALWICACGTMQDAPTWLIYDSPDGSGLAWSTIPDGPLDVADAVEARYVAGGHTGPGSVLQWLREELPWQALDFDGDKQVLQSLEPRLRGHQ